jgi:hypothetical protein
MPLTLERAPLQDHKLTDRVQLYTRKGIMAQQFHGRKGSGMRQQCELLLNNNITILLLQDRSSRWTFLFMSFSALAGFLLSLSPLSCMLMGWRGSSSNGATATGMYMFGGGGLLWFGGLGEWLVGNTFASVVFFAFGAFWLNFGAALIPSFNAYGSYSPSAEDPDLGLLTVAYNSGWGRFTLLLGCEHNCTHEFTAKRANNQAS